MESEVYQKFWAEAVCAILSSQQTKSTAIKENIPEEL